MAVRKDTIKQQFTEALPPVLEPGELVLGGAYGVSGPNPLWVPDLRHALLLRGAHRPPADLPERLVLDLAPQGVRVG